MNINKTELPTKAVDKFVDIFYFRLLSAGFNYKFVKLCKFKSNNLVFVYQ